ncbi:MAG: DUF2723 domain-containing protein [Elusimicrobia bacterium]|nr:DUF2723 domain-containing protein [Elusimicrobiota bacterium]
MTTERRAALAAGVFAAAFFLYMSSMPPGLAPYRDAGEFAVAAHTAGVAHPPSYPLYVLLGRAAEAFPWATTAYRLDLLSALCGAGAVAALTWLAAAAGPWAGLAAGLAFGLDAVPWSVSMVQEMYSLMAVLAAVLLALACGLGAGFSARAWLGACFLYGLALGDRTDILLWAPGLLVLALPAGLGGRRAAKLFAVGAGAALVGLSIYAFLPIRSAGGPWLDWNHPASAAGFWGSLTRKGYGGTLDLLSKSYRTGENFAANMRVYGAHLLRDMGLPVLLLAGAGCAGLWRRLPRMWAGTLLLYLASGPLFLWLANMPPNPHALAIVEPHYLLSDLILALWAAEGAARAVSGAAWAGPLLTACLLAAPVLSGRFERMDRRWDLFAHDWADNALRSVPKGAALVAKKDVQIFALWHHQKVLGRRPDAAAVAQGLAHSPWHQQAMRRAGAPVLVSGLRGAADWEAFLAANPSVWVTMDAELPAGVKVFPPRGIAAPVRASATGINPAPFMVVRGDARYESRPDFFSADLIDSYANARQRRGAALSLAGDAEAARRELWAAWALKHRSPEAADLLGYVALTRSELPEAVSLYESAGRLYDRTLELAADYNALPEVHRGISAAAGLSAVNLGVAYERMGRKDLAEGAYGRALRLDPTSSRAHFNTAVLYWEKDWRRVVAELEAALAADAGNVEAARFLVQARARLAAGQ